MPAPLANRDELVTEVCRRLSEGEPMTQICRDSHLPGDRTIREWVENDPAVSAAIARAREIGFDTIAARLRETARGMGESSGDVQRDKLIIETDLKLLAKWDPKRYGELLKLGGDERVPLVVRQDPGDEDL